MSEEIQLDIEEWISLQEDSPVSPSVSQESKTQTTIANSGLKCLELSKKSDPPTSLERMSEILLASEKEWYSNKCVLTWKVKATKCKRLYYLLQQSTHRTKDTDVGLWPTPRVADTEGGLVKNVEINKGSFSRVNKDGVRWGVKLKDAVNHMENKMWPTPTAKESGRSVENWEKANEKLKKRGLPPFRGLTQVVLKQEQMWPTPDASIRGARRNQNGHQVTLQDAVAGYTPEARAYMKETVKENTNQTTGQLNPQWVEWLMGYPIGWTDLKD